MTAHELVLGVTVGTAALVCGLVPGLFDGLIEGVETAQSLLSGAPAPHRHARTGRVPRPLWLAVAGAVFIVFTIAAYLLS